MRLQHNTNVEQVKRCGNFWDALYLLWLPSQAGEKSLLSKKAFACPQQTQTTHWFHFSKHVSICQVTATPETSVTYPVLHSYNAALFLSLHVGALHLFCL